MPVGQQIKMSKMTGFIRGVSYLSNRDCHFSRLHFELFWKTQSEMEAQRLERLENGFEGSKDRPFEWNST